MDLITIFPQWCRLQITCACPQADCLILVARPRYPGHLSHRSHHRYAPRHRDQRGLARAQAPRCDSGAFESQGFTLTGNGDQSAPLTQAFPNPLAVTVAANDANAPVSGRAITFTLIPGSASATFGAAGGTGYTVGVNLLTAACPVGADSLATTPPLTAGAATGTLTATANASTGTPITFTLTTYVAPGQVQPMANRAPNGPINDGPFTPQPDRHPDGQGSGVGSQVKPVPTGVPAHTLAATPTPTTRPQSARP